MNDLKTRLRETAPRYSQITGNHTHDIFLNRDGVEAAQHIEALEQEAKRLRVALLQILRAVEDGQVCDDVAWFNNFTTLHDFISETLNPPLPPVIADLFADTSSAGGTNA